MKFSAVYVPAPEGGYTAYVKELPEAISEGDTLEEARENLLDAIDTLFRFRREAGTEGEGVYFEELAVA